MPAAHAAWRTPLRRKAATPPPKRRSTSCRRAETEVEDAEDRADKADAAAVADRGGWCEVLTDEGASVISILAEAVAIGFGEAAATARTTTVCSSANGNAADGAIVRRPVW